MSAFAEYKYAKTEEEREDAVKRFLIASAIAGMMLLVGCGRNKPRTYGNTIDYSTYDTEDYHVVYAVGKDGCYTDGSFDSNMMFNNWVRNYEKNH